MSDLSISQLRRLDLTLLLVFLGLVRHRKAQAVAQELGLTPSAISQGLKRLRDIFGDDLFLRRPHGMEPTATALALEAPIARAVENLRGALGTAQAFDPMLADGILRIAALDAEQTVIIPVLASLLRKEAPGLRMSVLPFGRALAIETLIEGRAELVLGFLPETPDMIRGEGLYEETFLVVGRPDVLPLAPTVSLDAYCAADHVLVSPGGDLPGIVDTQLARLGRSRRVVLGLPAFLPALSAVAASGALVTLPSRVARAVAPGFGLVTAEPPIEVRTFPVSVFWHRRNDTDQKTIWLKDRLRHCVSGPLRNA